MNPFSAAGCRGSWRSMPGAWPGCAT
jgi:hypothetical protein